jgi:hypothetical protein
MSIHCTATIGFKLLSPEFFTKMRTINDEIDSAYGSPTDANFFQLKNDSDSNLEDWRFNFKSDKFLSLSVDTANLEMYKPHIISSIRRASVDTEAGPLSFNSDPSCPPWEIYNELGLNEREDYDIFSISEDEELPFEMNLASPFSPVSPTKDKAFPCSMCPSSFSRNHDLKRHTRYCFIN